MRDIKNSFIEKLHECNQHEIRLKRAKYYLKDIMPLDLNKYKNINEIEMSFIDQMIFRFSKLQDTLGEKIFPAILELVGEEPKKLTFIDKLNRFEELGLLYKDEWMYLRRVRNEIAHEYSFNQDEVVDSINLIFEKVDDLLRIYEDIFNYCYDKFEFVKNSKKLTKNNR